MHDGTHKELTPLSRSVHTSKTYHIVRKCQECLAQGDNSPNAAYSSQFQWPGQTWSHHSLRGRQFQGVVADHLKIVAQSCIECPGISETVYEVDGGEKVEMSLFGWCDLDL